MNRHLSKEDIQMNKWCMKTYSKSLVIREMQINTTMRYHFIPVRKTLIKRKPKTKDKCWQEYGNVGILVQRWWECILVQSLWETVWKFLKILKIELPYDPAISFLGIYPKKTKTNLKRYVHPQVCCSTIYKAKTWKQLKCPLIDKWMKKLWYICTMEYMEYCANHAVVSDSLQPNGR